ncbi:MAG: carboxylesterase/lipase family protein [Deltaproteobacteria bacterium]|nr:MAG: carboxylesterase/lipase family protein [Deltaproteobacteria bacterium]
MGMVVGTRNGRLEGTTERGVASFRGIPFARPPVGPLRFQPPEPPQAWDGVRSARAFGASAPQSPPVTRLIQQMVGAAPGVQSEDCLTLNVWTPAADGRTRPVMVWIHGGAFVMGSGATRLYSGARLARRGDLVVVSVNYRLGALGFLNLRALRPGDGNASSNLGLRDQIAALEWVRDNIEAFGGDPENVTIFGESAGGMSVATLLGTPRAQGLFQRAIAQSGAAHNVSSTDDAGAVAERFLSRLGVDPGGGAALRDVSVADILHAQRDTSLALGMPSGALPWQPSLDGELLSQPPLEAVGRGLARSVPLLVGTNRDEWKLFMLGDPKGRRLDEAGLRRRLERVLPGRDARGEPLAERAFEAYRESGADARRPTASERWVAFQSDRIFHVPAARLAERQSAHAPDTYAYRFDWTPPFLDGVMGAFHGLEVPFVFGTLRDPMLRAAIGWAPSARRLSQRMQDAWIAFARSGRPHHEALPAWPAYERHGRNTLFFTREPRVGEAPFGPVQDFWDKLL